MPTTFKVDLEKFNTVADEVLVEAKKSDLIKAGEKDESQKTLTEAQQAAVRAALEALNKDKKEDEKVGALDEKQTAEAHAKALNDVAAKLQPLFLFEQRLIAARMTFESAVKTEDKKVEDKTVKVSTVDEKDLETFKKAIADARDEMVAGFKAIGKPTLAEKAKDVALKIIGALAVAVLCVPYLANLGGFKGFMNRTFFSGARTPESIEADKLVKPNFESPFETVPAPK